MAGVIRNPSRAMQPGILLNQGITTRPTTLFLLSLVLLSACGRLNFELHEQDADQPDTGAEDTKDLDSPELVDNDRDGFTATVDCDDNDPLIHPGATEACDGIDNNCDDITDDIQADLTCGAQAGCVAGVCVPLPGDCSTATSYNSHTYVECTAALSWNEARQICQSWGGDLTSLNDAGEENFVGTWIASATIWIGYTDTDFPVNEFHWVDGSTQAYSNWCPGEPTNFSISGEYESCAARQPCNSSQQWNDLICSLPFSYVCERDNQ